MCKILVFSSVPTHPQDMGNKARIHSMLSVLKDLGHQIVFVFVEMGKGDKWAMSKAWDEFHFIPCTYPRVSMAKRCYDAIARLFHVKSVLPYRVDSLCPPEVITWAERYRDVIKPDVVMVEYVYLSKVFECFDDSVFKILDTHDIFSERHKIFLSNNIRKLTSFYTTRSEENLGLSRSDLAIAIQDDEADYFSQQNVTKIITVGHLVKVDVINSKPDPCRLLFVGSENLINTHGIEWFLQHVFPSIMNEFPGIELDIVGKITENLKKQPGINLIGYVTDLGQFYGKATLVINPIQFGTGLKIKTIEALAYGKPVITTPTGGEGVATDAENGVIIAHNAADFIFAIKKCLNSKSLLDKMKNEGLQYVDKYNEKVVSSLKTALDSVS